ACVMAMLVGLLGLEWYAPSGHWTTLGATPQEFDGTLMPLWGRNLLEEWASPAPCFAMACHAVCWRHLSGRPSCVCPCFRGRRCGMTDNAQRVQGDLPSPVREDATSLRRVSHARVPTGSHHRACALEHTVKRFARALLRWRWGVILVLVGVTSGALCGVARLRVDPSSDRLLPRQGPEAQVYQRFLTTFGSDEEILVVVHDAQQSLLAPAGLVAMRHLTHALEALPHVAAGHRLTTPPDMGRLRLTPFGLEVPHLVADAPLSEAQIAAIRHNDQVVGTLLAPDLHTAGLVVVPDAAVSGSGTLRETWLAAVRALAVQHAVDGRQTYVAGTPIE